MKSFDGNLSPNFGDKTMIDSHEQSVVRYVTDWWQTF